MNKEMFEMCFELEDILSVEETGYSNMYDITVTGDHSFLLSNGVVSHNSAFGGLHPVLGRKECGYYVLRGKPLNAYQALQSKFTENKELSELYKIIQNENYQYIIMGTDQDLDGISIRGLLLGFFERYLPEYKDKIGILQTPIKTVCKNSKILRWYYNMSDDLKLKKGEVSSYYKGLGQWDSDDLKYIVQQEGITKMIDMLEFNSVEIIDEWLGKDPSARKTYIMANEFNLTKL